MNDPNSHYKLKPFTEVMDSVATSLFLTDLLRGLLTMNSLALVLLTAETSFPADEDPDFHFFVDAM